MTSSRIASRLLSVVTTCTVLLSSGLQSAMACTDARVAALDGSVVSARSMEFGAPTDSVWWCGRVAPNFSRLRQVEQAG